MNEEGYRPDRIIALARGGAVPGVMLSHRLGIPVTIVAYSSKSGAGDNRNHDNILPTLPAGSTKLLIVDDLVDSGRSMAEVVEYYMESTQQIKVATMYAKEGTAVVPDYYWHWLNKDAPFIHFPWEMT